MLRQSPSQQSPLLEYLSLLPRQELWVEAPFLNLSLPMILLLPSMQHHPKPQLMPASTKFNHRRTIQVRWRLSQSIPATHRRRQASFQLTKLRPRKNGPRECAPGLPIPQGKSVSFFPHFAPFWRNLCKKFMCSWLALNKPYRNDGAIQVVLRCSYRGGEKGSIFFSFHKLSFIIILGLRDMRGSNQVGKSSCPSAT